MLGQKTYLKLNSKCKFCNHMNNDLETYSIWNPPNQKFKDDFVMCEIENEIGFLNSFTICDNCGKRYDKRIGIRDSKISGVVI